MYAKKLKQIQSNCKWIIISEFWFLLIRLTSHKLATPALEYTSIKLLLLIDLK
jgi:hypothetical protein